jgi:hypothetical protein
LWEFNDDEKVLETTDVNFKLIKEDDEQFLLCEQLSKLDDKDLYCAITDLGYLMLYKHRTQLLRMKVELN